MSKLSVELTADQQAFLESRRSAAGFATAGEYLLDMIRREQIEVAKDESISGSELNARMYQLKSESPDEYIRATARIRDAVRASIASGPPITMTEQEWDGLWLSADGLTNPDQAIHHG